MSNELQWSVNNHTEGYYVTNGKISFWFINYRDANDICAEFNRLKAENANWNNEYNRLCVERLKLEAENAELIKERDRFKSLDEKHLNQFLDVLAELNKLRKQLTLAHSQRDTLIEMLSTELKKSRNDENFTLDTEQIENIINVLIGKNTTTDTIEPIDLSVSDNIQNHIDSISENKLKLFEAASIKKHQELTCNDTDVENLYMFLQNFEPVCSGRKIYFWKEKPERESLLAPKYSTLDLINQFRKEQRITNNG